MFNNKFMGEKEQLKREVSTTNEIQIVSKDDFWGVDFDDDEISFVKKITKSKPKNLAVLYNDIYQFWLKNDKQINNLDDIDAKEYIRIVGSKNINDRERVLLKSIILKVVRDFYLSDKNIHECNNQSLRVGGDNVGNKSFPTKHKQKNIGGERKLLRSDRSKKNRNRRDVERLLILLGGRDRINRVTDNIIHDLKRDNLDKDAIKEKINSIQFIEDVADDLLGRNRYLFYSNERNKLKIKHLHEIVRNYLLSNLEEVFGSMLS